MVFQLKNSLKRRNGCQCWLRSRFWGLTECFVIEIDVKSDKGRSKSFTEQSVKDSIVSSELNKAGFSFLSAVESSGIEGAIKH
jgi:hypothetical protein